MQTETLDGTDTDFLFLTCSPDCGLELFVASRNKIKKSNELE